MIANFFELLKVPLEYQIKYLSAYYNLAQCNCLKFIVTETNETSIVIVDVEKATKELPFIIKGFLVPTNSTDRTCPDVDLDKFLDRENRLMLGPARHLNHSCRSPTTKITSYSGSVVQFSLCTNVKPGYHLFFQYFKTHVDSQPCNCAEVLGIKHYLK